MRAFGLLIIVQEFRRLRRLPMPYAFNTFDTTSTFTEHIDNPPDFASRHAVGSPVRVCGGRRKEVDVVWL
jgi:hypothetical protein